MTELIKRCRKGTHNRYIKVMTFMKKITSYIISFFSERFKGTRLAGTWLCEMISASMLTPIINDCGFEDWISGIVIFFVLLILLHVVDAIAAKILHIIMKRISAEAIALITAFIVIVCVADYGSNGFTIWYGVICFFSFFGVYLYLKCMAAYRAGRRGDWFLIILGGISAVVTALVFCFFLLPGFEKDYVSDLLKKQGTYENHYEHDSGLFTRGPWLVGAIDYGMDEDADIISEYYDLSYFAKEESSISGFFRERINDCTLEQAELEGRIWYPLYKKDCPLLFIIHGNHSAGEKSYLGYDYLGEYLASYGYAVVSVNENLLNENILYTIIEENDARAILLLENIRWLKEYCETRHQEYDLSEVISFQDISIAGHSRGGEAVSHAIVFNEYDVYPDNGNIELHYHFDIESVIALAPTYGQYLPAEHPVEIEDVNYLLIQGANDADVSSFCGMEQYRQVIFTGTRECFKSSLYICEANHGMFNSLWGDADIQYPMSMFIDRKNYLTEWEQQDITKLWMKTFLDATILGDNTNRKLLSDWEEYQSILPETIYSQLYEDSSSVMLCSFEEDSDLETGTNDKVIEIDAGGVGFWSEELTEEEDTYDDNHALCLLWREETKSEKKNSIRHLPQIVFRLKSYDMTGQALAFELADVTDTYSDMRKKKRDLLRGNVVVQDIYGNEAVAYIEDKVTIWPAFPVSLGKLASLTGNESRKCALQTIAIGRDDWETEGEFSFSNVVSITFEFERSGGRVIHIDNLRMMEE